MSTVITGVISLILGIVLGAISTTRYLNNRDQEED